MTATLLGLRFLLELCLLAAVAVVGFGLSDTLPLQLLASVLFVVATALVWGLLLSPKRHVDMPLGARVCIELLLFGGAAAGLAYIGYPIWGAALFIAEVLVVGALALMGMPPGSVVKDQRNPG